jgi:4-amino-4-deoxy-L-arabinose transferase-like glycosyltransferase
MSGLEKTQEKAADPAHLRVGGGIVLLLLLALAVRLWGIDFGLPITRARPDEGRIIGTGLRFFTGDYHPGFFHYPTLFMYLYYGVLRIYYLWGSSTGRFTSPTDLFVEIGEQPEALFLLDRLLVVAFSVATVWLLYLCVQRIAGPWAGLLAAGFLALAHLHVRDSHFGVTDVPMTALVMASMYFLLRARESGAVRHFVLAGLFAGLSMSTKYAGVFLVAPLLLVHLQVRSRERSAGVPTRFFLDRRPWLFGLSLAAAFFAGSPYALLDFSQFVHDVRFEMAHLSRGDAGLQQRGWWYHLHFSLRYGLGVGILGAGLLGGILWAFQRRWAALVWFAFPLVFYAVAGKGYTTFVRYVIPVVPFLCGSAGGLVAVLAARLAGPSKRAALSWSVVLASLVVLPSAYRVVRTNLLLTRDDSRFLARQWIEANVEDVSKVYLSTPWIKGAAPRSAAEIQGILERGENNPDAFLQSLWQAQLEAQGAGPSSAVSSDQPLDRRPEYIVMADHPLQYYTVCKPWLPPLVQRQYELRHEIQAIDASAGAQYFDLQDAFFVPFAGFAGVERPGPNLWIYQLKK